MTIFNWQPSEFWLHASIHDISEIYNFYIGSNKSNDYPELSDVNKMFNEFEDK